MNAAIRRKLRRKMEREDSPRGELLRVLTAPWTVTHHFADGTTQTVVPRPRVKHIAPGILSIESDGEEQA